MSWRRVFPVLLLLAASTALAHNGEYHPPLKPPRMPEDPIPDPGVPERTGEKPRGEATPGPRDTGPNDPVESPPAAARPTVYGVQREDARFTPKIWWEANRHRFLPPPPTLPRDALCNALVEAVDTPGEIERQQALLALGRTGTVRAIDRIRKACNDEDPELRVAALVALGLLREDVASAMLREIVADAEAGAGTRAFAVLGLGLLGSAENAGFLREVLNEEWQTSIRSGAALALGLLRDADSTHALGRVMLGLHPLESRDRDSVGGPEGNAGLACCAAWALGEILTPKAYDYLVWAVDRGSVSTRVGAAIALASAPGTVGVPVLRRSLAAGHPLPLRQCALVGLAERGDDAASEAAIEVLEADVEYPGSLAPFAALALGLAGAPEHSERLLGILGDREAEPDLRAAAALGLGLSGNRAAAAALEKLVRDEKKPAVAGWGVIACAMLASPNAYSMAVKILEDSQLPEPRRDAITALGILGNSECTDLLVNELGDSYHVNREAGLALARANPRRAAAELTGKLSDPNLFARRFAAHTLGVLLDRDRPGRLTGILSGVNLLGGSRVVTYCAYLDNEYLFQMIRHY